MKREDSIEIANKQGAREGQIWCLIIGVLIGVLLAIQILG